MRIIKQSFTFNILYLCLKPIQWIKTGKTNYKVYGYNWER